MNNPGDYFRDPRLDDFDDPQIGGPQLDDLLDPVRDPKISNRMARYYYAVITATSGVKFPNDTGATTFIRNLEIPPDYWIVRLFASAVVILPTTAVIISREGGDDIGVFLPIAPAGVGNYTPEKRLILPGASRWLQIQNNSTAIVYANICAMSGYNPNDIF